MQLNLCINTKICMATLVASSIICFLYMYVPVPQDYSCRKEVFVTTVIPRILGFQSFPQEIKNSFNKFSSKKTESNNTELIAFLKTIIQPPSDNKLVKMSRSLIKTPQAEEVDKILNKKAGFFVEAGALDGERSSNTIFLEVEKGWTGLLVEPDPYFYTQLIGKNRNSWAINACLSPTNYVTNLRFKESSGGHGKIRNDKSNEKFIIEVPCFPLESMLLAIGRTSVDFFSLDVEGAEVPVLKTIPFDKIDIKTLAVEYKHGKYNEYLDLMESKGYKMVKKLLVEKPEISLYVEDFIFVKNELENQ